MCPRVFLSYSWRDSQVAMRVYNDLSRLNISIWRDQIDGDPFADFEREFMEKIDQCDYFILLDSSNYRAPKKTNSEWWCLKEVKRCLENQKKTGSPKIVVCLLQEDGEWRKSFPNPEARWVFEQINALKYQCLYYTGYDDCGVYSKSLNSICELLGPNAKAWDSIPTCQDLIDELKEIDYNGVQTTDEESVRIVIDGYRTLYSKIIKNYPNIKDSFRIWIEDFHHLKKELFFPKWTYAVWLINQPSFETGEALACFDELCKVFPSNPRCFKGMGIVHAVIAKHYEEQLDKRKSIEHYQSALNFLLKCEELTLIPQNHRHRDVCIFDLWYNIGSVHCYLHQERDALAVWEKALQLMLKEGFFREDLVEHMFCIKENIGQSPHDILKWLQSLKEFYPLEGLVYYLMALCYTQIEDNMTAFHMLKRAGRLSSKWSSMSSNEDDNL